MVQQRSGRARAAHPAATVVQREPATATFTIGAIAAKCIIGALVGALIDVAIQSGVALFKGKPITIDKCSVIVSAVLSCIAAPVSAVFLDAWVAARLGPVLGATAATLVGKLLIFFAKKLAIGVPKSLVAKLLKLGCITPGEAKVLGVSP